jgi:hypothetical protein
MWWVTKTTVFPEPRQMSSRNDDLRANDRARYTRLTARGFGRAPAGRPPRRREVGRRT